MASQKSGGPAKLETLRNGTADDRRRRHAERPLEEPVQVAVTSCNHTGILVKLQEVRANGGELGAADETILRNPAVPPSPSHKR